MQTLPIFSLSSLISLYIARSRCVPLVLVIFHVTSVFPFFSLYSCHEFYCSHVFSFFSSPSPCSLCISIVPHISLCSLTIPLGLIVILMFTLFSPHSPSNRLIPLFAFFFLHFPSFHYILLVLLMSPCFPFIPLVLLISHSLLLISPSFPYIPLFSLYSQCSNCIVFVLLIFPVFSIHSLCSPYIPIVLIALLSFSLYYIPGSPYSSWTCLFYVPKYTLMCPKIPDLVMREWYLTFTRPMRLHCV